MQENSLVTPTMDYTELLSLVSFTGIIPKPGIIFVCKGIEHWPQGDVIFVEECTILPAYKNYEDFTTRVEIGFSINHWVEIAPPQEVSIDELMPEEAFALI